MRLTPGELKVMQILWMHGELKPAEIHALFGNDIKNPALRSYLKILLDKGHVTRRQVGKAYVYKAKTRQHAALKSMLGSLIDTFFEGSRRKLLLSLVQQEKLTAQDIAEIKAATETDDQSDARNC
jgi:predicted transcriptional regulator